MKYNIIRVKAGSDELEGETIATGLTTPEFEDTDVEPGKRYEYIIEAYTDDGQYQDRNVVFAKTNGPELPTAHKFISAKEITWDNLPTFDGDNGSLKLVEVQEIEIIDLEWLDEHVSDIPNMNFDELKEWLDAGGFHDWIDQAPVITEECFVYEADFNWDNSSEGKHLSWLIDVLAFKENQISNGDFAFIYSTARHFTALPTLDTSNLTSMKGMFAGCSLFNQSLDNFDTSRVTDMQSMFAYNFVFNQPLSHFEMGNVKNTYGMFVLSAAFDQDINNWDVAGITTSYGMFAGALAFNNPLDQWDVSDWRYSRGGTTDKANFSCFLLYCSSFDQDISGWCVENAGTTHPYLFSYGSPIFNDDAKEPKWGQAC